MSRDALDRLREALDGLDAEPVAAHPDVLDEVHRDLVADLDALSRAVAPPAQEGD
jgi:hypothetical protein